MTLYRDTFRIESTRLRYWDYADYGWYFITICVQNHECVLGKIVDGVIQPTPAGRIVEQELLRTIRRRPEAELDMWCIMPNHLHLILVVDNLIKQRKQSPVSSTSTVPYEEPEPVAKLEARSLGSVINRFKNNATKRIRKSILPAFEWQERFHDHVIRNEKELQSIREYILQNPGAWEEDEYHPRHSMAINNPTGNGIHSL
ncbi:MAG TPA: transposase [Candidatus Peribacterales bacterium]|nr:transposase [Candidatus Peribacterales bacterium]